MMAVIFVASSRAKAEMPDFGALDLPAKKAGHLLVYALLAFAWMRGLSFGRPPTLRDAALAVLLSAAYGLTDEYHQSFIAGRNGNLVDVGIDAIGALLGVSVARALRLAREARAGLPKRS